VSARHPGGRLSPPPIQTPAPKALNGQHQPPVRPFARSCAPAGAAAPDRIPTPSPYPVLLAQAVDAASNVGSSHPLSFNVSHLRGVSAGLRQSISGLVDKRVTQLYSGRIMLANISGAAIAGPLQLKIQGLLGGQSIAAVAAVPEPESHALMLAGLAALGLLRRRPR